MIYLLCFLWILFLAGFLLFVYGLCRKKGISWFCILEGICIATVSLYDLVKVCVMM